MTIMGTRQAMQKSWGEERMLSKLFKLILIPPLLIMVTALVIIGLAKFDLLTAIIPKVIVVVIIVSVPVFIVKTVLFSKHQKKGGEKG